MRTQLWRPEFEFVGISSGSRYHCLPIRTYHCVRSSILHGSETWPVRKENVVALQRAEMRMVRWMCGIKLIDIIPSKEPRERLGVDDVALVLQQNRLHRYGHVLQKEDNDWVKKCMEYEVEGPREEEDQRVPGERLSKRTVKHIN